MYFPFVMTENNPCSSKLRNTQELCFTTRALRNTGVHDLCISSEIFTPRWGAKWGKSSVTTVAPFSAALRALSMMRNTSNNLTVA